MKTIKRIDPKTLPGATVLSPMQMNKIHFETEALTPSVPPSGSSGAAGTPTASNTQPLTSQSSKADPITRPAQ